jgi:hypothetical protein
MVKKVSSAPPPPRTLSGAGQAMRVTRERASLADWSKWAQLLQVEVWQGVALSLGFEPVEERVRWGELAYKPERYGPEFKSRLTVAVSHVRDGHPKLLDARVDAARDVVYLAHFARWAEQNMDWKLPEQMVELAWGVPIRDPARWRRMGTWTLHEAAHLLAGKEPVPPERFDVHASARGPEQDLYAALKDAVIESKSIESFDGRGSPKYMLRRVRALDVTTWAAGTGWVVPEAFTDLPRPVEHPSEESAPSETEQAEPREDAESRRARYLREHESLTAKGDLSPTKTLAAQAGVSESRIRQLLKAARDDRTRAGVTPSARPIGHPLDLGWKQRRKR